MDVRAGQRSVIVANRYRVPLRLRPAVVDIGEAGAAIEHIVANSGHTNRDCQAGQTGTAFECGRFDAGHAFRNRHAGQAAAFIERRLIDAG